MDHDEAPAVKATKAVKLMDVKSWPNDYRVYALCGIAVVGMLATAGYRGWDQLRFITDPPITSIFSSLLLVSLFVERVIEVFVSVWVDKQSSAHEQNLSALSGARRPAASWSDGT